MTNVEAFKTAKHKAKYGRKDHLVWCDRAGEFHASPRSAATIKAALLAIGTTGHFTEICGTTLYRYGWRDGCRMIRNARYGC